MSPRVFLAPPAEADIDDILEWSERSYGPAVRDGYEALIDAAIQSLAIDPERLGSHPRDDLREMVRTLHLKSCRDEVSGQVLKIAKPKHLVVYRLHNDRLEVIRLLHEAMDIPEHLTT